MKIWIISDTHQLHDQLQIPVCDLVIHCGDFANTPRRIDNLNEAKRFLKWWNKIDCKKLLIGGNHDLALYYKDILPTYFDNTTILNDSFITINGLNFCGSSWSPTFGSDRWVYNKARGKLAEIWKNIPDDTDVFIGHTMPQGFLDIARDYSGNGRQLVQVGCKALTNRLQQLPNLKLVLGGHIHSNPKYGIYNSGIFTDSNNIKYINASVCDDKYELLNNGYVIEI